MDKFAALKQYFGHSEFRPGQEQLVDALLSGQDVLGVMPTGAGKSVCYQLPAVLLPGVTLVVSPLISLMKDQVASLKQAGIPAAYLNSSLTAQQFRIALHRAYMGAYKLIYVAPERLAAPGFLQFARETRISLLAVDEAHCVSQWGQDFRPSYLKIADFLAQLPSRPAVGAFTATATDQVKDDISRLLPLQNPLRLTTGFDRPNLFFEIVRTKDKLSYLKQFLSGRSEQSGIVYCATRKMVEEVCAALTAEDIRAARYHAGLSDEERRQNQEDFVYDRVRVMAATNAFGMGIDKSNVSFVVHYNMPKDVESYYQEAGRAGRDGSNARCVLLFSEGDIRTAKFLITNSAESEELPEEERERLRLRNLRRLDQMTAYCKTGGCLRGYLLRYFGESAPERCGSCGNCTGDVEERDMTTEAQKILSAVVRVERKYPSSLGVSLIIRLLRGSQDQRVLQLGLDKIRTYGAMREVDRTHIRTYIDALISQGYLYLDGTDYPVLRITPLAKPVLFEGKPVTLLLPRQTASRQPKDKRPASPLSLQADEGLLEILRNLRTKLAASASVPAYVIFSNASLLDMAARQPSSMRDFMEVSGVGTVKAQRYGEQFLEAIRAWKRDNQLDGSGGVNQ